MYRLSFCVVASAMTAGSASAEKPSRPDPTDASAIVVPAAYSSSFDFYRPDRTPEVVDWRGANDAVGRIGGWRSYQREAQQPDPASGSSTSSPLTQPSGQSGSGTPAAPGRRDGR